MATTYKTKSGDRLDAIAFKHYGAASHFQKILEANPELAGQNETLPEGLKIILPDPPEQEPEKLQRLWE
jgi:phage tail protein X